MKYNKSKQIIEEELDTSFILAMRYRAPCVELSVVCRHYFPNLKNISEINRKASQQGFPFPVFRADPNNKRSGRYSEITKRLHAGTKTPVFDTVTQAVSWVSQEADNVHKPVFPACFLASQKSKNWSISYTVYQINATAKAVVWVREVENHDIIYDDWLSTEKFEEINKINHQVSSMIGDE